MFNGDYDKFYKDLLRDIEDYFLTDLDKMWESINQVSTVKVFVCPVYSNDFYCSVGYAVAVSEAMIQKKLLKILVFNNADYRPEYFRDYPHETIKVRSGKDFAVFMDNLNREIALKVQGGIL